VEKNRAAINKGKITWLYNAKVIIAMFAPHEKTGQKYGSKEKIVNCIIGMKTTRSTWMKRGKGSKLSLVCQAA